MASMDINEELSPDELTLIHVGLTPTLELDEIEEDDPEELESADQAVTVAVEHLNVLTRFQSQIAKEGVDRSTASSLKTMTQGQPAMEAFFDRYPPASFTAMPSRTNLAPTMESIGGRIMDAVVKAAKAIWAFLKKVWGKVTGVFKWFTTADKKNAENQKLLAKMVRQLRSNQPDVKVAASITEKHKDKLKAALNKAAFRYVHDNNAGKRHFEQMTEEMVKVTDMVKSNLGSMATAFGRGSEAVADNTSAVVRQAEAISKYEWMSPRFKAEDGSYESHIKLDYQGLMRYADMLESVFTDKASRNYSKVGGMSKPIELLLEKAESAHAKMLEKSGEAKDTAPVESLKVMRDVVGKLTTAINTVAKDYADLAKMTAALCEYMRDVLTAEGPEEAAESGSSDEGASEGDEFSNSNSITDANVKDKTKRP